jgi:hypothetical protein
VLPSIRFVRWAVLGSSLVAIVVSVVLAGRSPSSPQSLSSLFGGASTQTQWGPVSTADRDMLIKLRQADLWNGPTGEQAAAQAGSPAVRAAGAALANSHGELDVQLMQIADQLRVTLPSQPSDQQQVWMSAIASAPPQRYDATYVNLTRAAYGELMPLIEGVRAGTQNQLVRWMAMEASASIEPNMRALESTGLVNYSLLPPSTSPASRLSAIGGYTVPVTLLLFLLAVVVSTVMLRALTPKKATAPRSKEPSRPARPGRNTGSPEERTVTTGELLAVLKPSETPAAARTVPQKASPAASRTVPMPRAQPDHKPPKLGKRGGPGW